jgi:hypothetical protein
MNGCNHQEIWRDICNRKRMILIIPSRVDSSLKTQINILFQLNKKIIILLALKRRRIHSMVHLDRFLVRVLSHICYTERRKISVCTCTFKRTTCNSMYCFGETNLFYLPIRLVFSKECHYHSTHTAKEICLNCFVLY